MNSILECSPAKGLAILVALMAPALTAQTVWNPTTDFSITSGNPNGVWTYGMMDLGFATFTPLSSTTTDGFGFELWQGSGGGVGKNASVTANFGVLPGYLTLHPGSANEPAILRWTTPVGFTGSIDVVGQFLAGDSGSMLVAVRRGGTVLWSDTDFGVFNLSSLAVVPGDTLDFAVFGGYGFGNTPLEFTITGTPIPEPSAYGAVAGMVMLGLAIVRRSGRAK